MKAPTISEQIERLEDQLQAVKWAVRPLQPIRRIQRPALRSIVSQTAGLLRGRLPEGRVYERKLRAEWERRLKREAR